ITAALLARAIGLAATTAQAPYGGGTSAIRGTSGAVFALVRIAGSIAASHRRHARTLQADEPIVALPAATAAPVVAARVRPAARLAARAGQARAAGARHVERTRLAVLALIGFGVATEGLRHAR